MVLLLVPLEAVLAAPAHLGVQHVLDAGPGGGLAVGEVGRVLQVQADQPPVLEGVVAEGVLPAAVVGVDRAGVVGDGQIRHQGLVQRGQPVALGAARSARGGGAVPSHPAGGTHPGGEHQVGAVGQQDQDEEPGSHGGQQCRSAPVLGRAAPPVACPARLAAQPRAMTKSGWRTSVVLSTAARASSRPRVSEGRLLRRAERGRRTTGSSRGSLRGRYDGTGRGHRKWETGPEEGDGTRKRGRDGKGPVRSGAGPGGSAVRNGPR